MKQRLMLCAWMFVVALLATDRAVAQDGEAQQRTLPPGVSEEDVRKQIEGWRDDTDRWRNTYNQQLAAKLRQTRKPDERRKIQEKLKRIRSTKGKVILVPPLDLRTAKPGEIGQYVPSERERGTCRALAPLVAIDGDANAVNTDHVARAGIVYSMTSVSARVAHPRSGETCLLKVVLEIDIRSYAPEGVQLVNDLDPRKNDLGKLYE